MLRSIRTPLFALALFPVLSACEPAHDEVDDALVSRSFANEGECVDPAVGPEQQAAPPDASTPVLEVRERGTLGLPFDPQAFKFDDTIRVGVNVDDGQLRRTEDGLYAEISLDDASIQIVNELSPRVLPPADLVLHVGDRELLGLQLTASYVPNEAGGFELSIAANDDGTGAGGGILLGPQNLAIEPTCITDAFVDLVGHMPKDMPPVVFPDITGNCTDAVRCRQLRKAWAHAHVETFWAYLMIEYIAAHGPEDREFLWAAEGRTALDQPTGHEVAPAWWFGTYDSHWFSRVRGVVEDIWGVFHSGTHGSQTLVHHCPTEFGEPANLCYTFEPSAHHFDRGEINFCPRWFQRDFGNQVRLAIHESTHHLYTEGLAIIDNQTHGHGSNCVADIVTGPVYGPDEVHHFATYVALNDAQCLHRDIATRTTDAYAQMIHSFGRRVVSGWMVEWPSTGVTPQAPDCSIGAGEEGGCCLATNFNNPPDGDVVDQYCPDNDGEMTCVQTTFNASETLGICTGCGQPGEPQKPLGCECFGPDDCAAGLSCYGWDTHGGGGVGHCYSDQGLPEWQCGADCQRLFNDGQAVCAHDYPGGAHCFPLGCAAEPEYMECPMNNDGVCHIECEGNECGETCGAECVDAQDCWALGYPSGFECIGSVCRFPS